MNKMTMLKRLNPIMGVLVLNQAITGLLHDFLTPDTFAVIHAGGGIILLLGITLHVIFNWNWVRAHYFKKNVPSNG